MIEAGFLPTKKRLKILCIGAHCDDIEIGCGGTLLKLFDNYSIESVKWVVFASNELRAKEAKMSADAWLDQVENKSISIKSYRDAFLNFSALDIKEDFEVIKKEIDPDVIFTHFRHDRHQDHRLLSDLTWNTFRSHLIFEYEIPKYDGDLAQPNVFVHLSEKYVEKKVQILLQSFKSQTGKHWFDRETFMALMRVRGIESAASDRYAEAYHVRKLVLS